MNAPLGSADFFALEAGECLDRLDTQISRPEGSDPAEFLRYARALRGSALMANQTAIARAAAGFEALARAWRDGKRPMDPASRERAGHAVEEVRHLVRRAREWTPADEARAGRVASELAALAGGEIRDPRLGPAPVAPQQAQTGIRAFVAREGALVASALDRAARSLESTPEAREPLYAVLRRMQSLRGLAELSELSPLPEVLDGVEFAVGDLTRLFAPPPDVPALLDSAAAALTRIARDVAERGAPDPAAAEPQIFTDRLLRAFASEDDVVPIEALLDGDLRQAMTPSSAQPQFAAPSPLGTVELVSHGEHLIQAASRLMQAPSATARDLRLYALVPPFRSAMSAGRDPLTPALARYARAACRTIADGTAAAAVGTFAESLRAAGGVLRNVADAGLDAGLGVRLDALAAALSPAETLVDAPATVPTEAPTATPVMPTALPETEVVPIESLAPEPVAIESLAYDGESVFAAAAVEAAVAAGESSVVEILSLAPDEHLPLEHGFSTYHRLRSGAPAAEAVVDIRTLCFTGRRALERAAEVRSEIAGQMERRAGLDALEPLLRELLDLVPLAMDGA